MFLVLQTDMPGKRKIFDEILTSKVRRFKPYEKEGKQETQMAWKKVATLLEKHFKEPVEVRRVKNRTKALLGEYKKKLADQKLQ